MEKVIQLLGLAMNQFVVLKNTKGIITQKGKKLML
jgi:hypothetical protein